MRRSGKVLDGLQVNHSIVFGVVCMWYDGYVRQVWVWRRLMERKAKGVVISKGASEKKRSDCKLRPSSRCLGLSRSAVTSDGNAAARNRSCRVCLMSSCALPTRKISLTCASGTGWSNQLSSPRPGRTVIQGRPTLIFKLGTSASIYSPWPTMSLVSPSSSLPPHHLPSNSLSTPTHSSRQFP